VHGSVAGSYLRLIDFVYHSTLGLRVMKKKEEVWGLGSGVLGFRILRFRVWVQVT